MQVEVIETTELGDRSYIAHDGSVAVVVDPQRDLDRIEARLDELGLTCQVVLETHIHNDYVTGGYALARRTGAAYALAADEPVGFERHGMRDGDTLRAGDLCIRAIATPGHTDTHLAYVIEDVQDEGSLAAFTGGSLLYGSVGRTDLVDPVRTEDLARAQFHSARRLAELLDDDAEVFPTHGFGSFCSAGSAGPGGHCSTIGEQRTVNDALIEEDEDAFVERMVAGLTAYPRYYAHMAVRNREGPAEADLSPPEPVEAAELRRRLAAGEWVVDLRDRVAYAAEHLGGTIGIPLGRQFATYLGWLMPWGTPLTLIGDSSNQVAGAQRQLARIGIDRPAGAAVGDPAELAGGEQLRRYRRATFDDLQSRLGQDGDSRLTVLDVRRDDERARGGIPGSVHVPVHALVDQLDALPTGELWVHCASGYRASISASLLDRSGHDVVLIDDEYGRAVQMGLATG